MLPKGVWEQADRRCMTMTRLLLLAKCHKGICMETSIWDNFKRALWSFSPSLHYIKEHRQESPDFHNGTEQRLIAPKSGGSNFGFSCFFADSIQFLVKQHNEWLYAADKWFGHSWWMNHWIIGTKATTFDRKTTGGRNHWSHFETKHPVTKLKIEHHHRQS